MLNDIKMKKSEAEEDHSARLKFTSTLKKITSTLAFKLAEI